MAARRTANTRIMVGYPESDRPVSRRSRWTIPASQNKPGFGEQVIDEQASDDQRNGCFRA